MMMETPRKQWARDLAALIADENRAWLEAVERGDLADAALTFGTLTTTMFFAGMWFPNVITRNDPQAVTDRDSYVHDPATFNSRAIACDPCNVIDRRKELHEKYHEIRDLLDGMERAEGSVN